MTFFGMLFVAAVLALGSYAMATNHDIFSPAKFYIFSFILFFGGIAFGDWGILTWILVIFVGSVGVLTAIMESKIGKNRNSLAVTSNAFATRQVVEVYAVVIIWVLTLPAIISQAYLIILFGGIEEYINTLGYRVQEFRGYGYLTSIAGTYMVINLIYFGFLNQRQTHARDWLLFIAHFTGLITLGALTSSRGALLNGIVLLLLIFHYQRKRIPLWFAMTAAVSLIVLAGVAGTVRENLKFEEGEFLTGLDTSDDIVKRGSLSTGVTSLDILAKSELTDLRLGSTLLSVITNIVPRELWPEKPDTGGVVFTIDYASDEWRGFSNLTPTLLGEFILNFGWVAGVLIFFSSYSWLMHWLLRNYRRILLARSIQERADDYFFHVVLYILLMWGVVALMAGEVTNTVTPFIVTKLVPLLIVRRIFLYFRVIKAKSSIFN